MHGIYDVLTCGQCGTAIPSGYYHSCRPVEHPKGWQCPVCGTVYAPTTPNCFRTHEPPSEASTGANTA